MNKLGAAILLLLAGTASAAERLEAVQVAGLTVPGTPSIAKDLGFVDCADKYRYYECTRTKPVKVYGATTTSASVFIDGKDNFSAKSDSTDGPKISEVAPEKLSYKSIRLEFHLTEREILESALLADGWLKSGSGNSRAYFKEGVPATFSIHRSLTVISPIETSEANSQAVRLKALAAGAAKASASSSSFIDDMKK